MEPGLEYPSWRDIDREHDKILADYPEKREGELRSPLHFKEVIREAKAETGVYRKAAVFFKEIGGLHVYKDGNSSLALAITKLFLEQNGEAFKPPDGRTLGKVVNNHGLYDRNEIAEYLWTGEIDETSLPP